MLLLAALALMLAAAVSPAPAECRPPDPVPLDVFFEATSFDGRVADAALARIAAGWEEGHAAIILDLARFTRPSDTPVSQDLSGIMPHVDPQGAPAMPRYPGAHFGTLGSARADPTTAIRRRLLAFLERQTGQRFQDDLHRGRAWLWRRPYQPPPEYTAFKAALYQRVDPAIARFFKTHARAAIRLDEIEWAGVGANDLAPLFYPAAVPAAAAREVRDLDDVVGVSVNGETRAYPRRVLASHLLIHDRVGGVEILVVHDPVGRIATAYDLGAAGGALPRFGTSGLVYRAIMLMFDERTASLWSPLTGEAVLGDLLGAALQPLPVTATTWRQWRARHPSTATIVAPGRGTRTPAADRARTPFLVYPLPTPPHLKASSMVAVVDGVAIPADALPRDGVRQFAGASRRLAAVTWRDGAFAVYDTNDVRLVRRRAGRLEDERGRLWRIDEDALVLDDSSGERLPRIAAPLATWAAWHAHEPAVRPAMRIL